MPRRESSESMHSTLPLFECTKCGACCREDSILITLAANDIAKISRALELSPDEMLRALDFYIVTGNQSTPRGLQGIPAPLTERGPAFIALKKMKNGDCIFLKDNLCMIHAIRPLACKSFPFTFSKRGGEQFWGLSAAKHICPGLGIGPSVQTTDLQKLSDEVHASLQEYSSFVKKWNKRPKPTSMDLIRAIISESASSD